jgi:hypothetical protein
MSPIEDGRSDFRDRVDKHPNPNWPPLPLTRIANALVAADIAKSGFVDLVDCKVFGKPLAYFFLWAPCILCQRAKRAFGLVGAAGKYSPLVPANAGTSLTRSTKLEPVIGFVRPSVVAGPVAATPPLALGVRCRHWHWG